MHLARSLAAVLAASALALTGCTAAAPSSSSDEPAAGGTLT